MTLGRLGLAVERVRVLGRWGCWVIVPALWVELSWRRRVVAEFVVTADLRTWDHRDKES